MSTKTLGKIKLLGTMCEHDDSFICYSSCASRRLPYKKRYNKMWDAMTKDSLKLIEEDIPHTCHQGNDKEGFPYIELL